jgi:hypothetical protein
MLELSENLIGPSMGALTGFVSASSGTGRGNTAPPSLCNLAGKFHGWKQLCQAWEDRWLLSATQPQLWWRRKNAFGDDTGCTPLPSRMRAGRKLAARE